MATNCCLSPEIIKEWEKSGKNDFAKLCKSSANNDNSLSGTSLRRVLYELCYAINSGQIKLESAVSILDDLKGSVAALSTVLADTLGVVDIETSCSGDDAAREKFLTFVGALKNIVPDNLLKERLDQDSLEVAGLVGSQQTFNQKYVKTKTRLYYKQQKFNLLREESEGYSKLLTELNRDFFNDTKWEHVLQNIKSLIGCFDLDPNRVLDIILEAFECHPENESFYIPLLRAYIIDKLTLCHILGFKFQFKEQSADWSTPKSLYTLAALLLKNNLLDLEDLYAYLLPLDSEIFTFYNKEVLDAKAYARKLNTVILSDAKKEDEKDKEEPELINMRNNNQKLGLCEALLEIGAWDKAKAILDRLPENFAIVQHSLSSALCSLIHHMIDPVYEKNTGMTHAVAKKRSKQKHVSTCPQIHTYQQLYHHAMPMMSYLGPFASRDPVLLIKFLRLGRSFMSKRHSGGVGPEDDIAYYGFLNVLEEVILPSLCLLPSNCSFAEDIWNLLKLYPYEIRYRLFGTWKNESYFMYPVLIKARADCLEKAKYIMKRLTKETVKPSGRQLGKLTHNNPGIVLDLILTQIQRYDNLIGPVVDALKYLTPLSYDNLLFCLIEAIANPEKERMKTDNTSISLWLQSLCSFAGAICRKYQIELTGIMQYVANQLKAGKSTDLLLLREVVQKMAGIEISDEVNDEQLDAMAGGELVKQEGGNFSQIRNTKKSSTRLKDTLLEHDLALSLCLLMSQQRDSTVFAEDTNKHLKLVGKLYDQCQDTLVQFGSFLSMQLSTEEFVKRLPPIDVLLSTYHIPHSAAFFLSRSLYSYSISTKYDEFKKSEKSTKSLTKVQHYIKASEEVMSPVVEAIKPMFPSHFWTEITPQFYITFWSLSMYDLYVPTAAYEKQVQLLQSQINALDDNRDMPANKKKKEVERCRALMEKLRDEEKRQTEHVERVMERLEKEKESWFSPGTLKSEMTTNLLQYCLFPRCCFTASDAVYCSHFIKVLHNLKTPNFSTLITYDRIFTDITYTVTSCTENEARRYGRYLCNALENVMRWHSNLSIYDKECYDYPGFLTVFRKGADTHNKMDRLDYENFRHVCHKWHFRLTKSIITCIESKNYCQIRNTIIVLIKILPHFPRISQIGLAIERRVDKLIKEEKDKRPDIHALATGYSGQLKGRKGTWVHESAFHIKETRKPASNSAQQTQRQAESNGSTGKSKDNKEVSVSRDEKKDKSDIEKRERKDRSDKKENREKRESKRDNGVTIKKERESPEECSIQHAMDLDEDMMKPVKVKEEKQKKSDRKEKEALKMARKEEKRERKEREAASQKEDERHQTRMKEDREERSSGTSHSSSYRKSDEPSPRHLDERDSKRRKLESSGVSQDSGHDSRNKYHKSPTIDEDDRDWDREKERKEKKREHSAEFDDYGKRRKNEDLHSISRKSNGEPNGSKNYAEKEYKEKSNKQGHASRKEQFIDPDESPKLKIKEKREKSSSKKQKK